ncbi:hypothetical protein VPHK359_0010 [Vibrio phage K359]
MKIGDKFQLPVFYEYSPLSEVAKFSAWQGNGEICKSLFLAFDDCDADLICEAINNHDRMVDEIAELRSALESLHNIALLGDFGAEVYSETLFESDVLRLLNQEGEE